MGYLDFISTIHKATRRDYLKRVVESDKAACAQISKQFGKDYFDGDRRYGYGGYQYDGRWRPFAEKLIAHYGLKSGGKVLDIGCAKGFLLQDFIHALPGLEVAGLDVSDYAIANAMPKVKQCLRVGTAAQPLSAGFVQGLARDRARGAPAQIHRGGFVSQRARESKPAVLAAHLRMLFYACRMGVDFSSNRLQRGLGFCLFRVGSSKPRMNTNFGPLKKLTLRLFAGASEP